MKIFARLIVITAVSLLAAMPAFPEEGTVISADKVEQMGAILLGEGNVVIESNGSVLKAGRVRYDTGTKEVVAEDDVYYEDDKTKITASKAEMNMYEDTGVLYDADVLFKEQSYRVFGTRLEKKGPYKYYMDTGSLTTCTGLVPAWCVKGHKVKLEIGESVSSTNATLRVKNFPVLYTPYFWAPVVVDRRTGFLFPEPGYSNKKGFTWRQPFFWVLSENRDITLLADYYSKRGLGLGAEYRYIEAPDVKGSMSIFNLDDSELDRDFREFRAEHRHKYKNLRGFYDIAYVNQKDFYREYEPYIVQSSRRFLESQAEVSLNTPHARLFADARYLRELQDDQDQKLVVQKLPEVGVFVKPFALGPVVGLARAEGANFVAGSGTDGKRLNSLIRLSNTIGMGPTFSQNLDMGYTFYDLDGVAAPMDETRFDRVHVSYTGEFRTSFARNFGEVEHIVLPAMSYTYRQYEREAVPLFDSTELHGDINALALNITNRLRDKSGEFLTMAVTETYDFRRDDDNLGPINMELNFNRMVSLAFGLTYDIHERTLTSTRSNVGLRYKRFDLTGGHTFTKGGITMYNAALGFNATQNLKLKSEAWYDATNGGLERINLGFVYDSQCWAVDFDYTKRQDEKIIFLTLTLKGLGDVIRI